MKKFVVAQYHLNAKVFIAVSNGHILQQGEKPVIIEEDEMS